MNILAHIYLSHGINDLMIGNFIGDFVKGNTYEKYPANVRNGILLHRKIDSFVDKHMQHRFTRDRLRSKYGLYSGIVVDIIYDHFLSKNWLDYHDVPLPFFSKEVYDYIQGNLHVIPKKMYSFIPYMIKNNWFEMYGSILGVERVLKGMAKRTSLPDYANFAINILESQYAEINNEFKIIFNDLNKLVSDNIILYKFATK